MKENPNERKIIGKNERLKYVIRIKYLSQQLDTAVKALELACESLAVCYNRENIEYGVDVEMYNQFSLFNDFIEQAKENLK